MTARPAAAAATSSSDADGTARTKTGRPDTVARILKGASRAFLDHGYELATMDMVAGYAGVARASLYNHFSSKEELFTVLMREGSRDFVARATDVEEAEPWLELRGTAERVLSEACKSINMYRVVISESARFPWLAKLFYESGISPIRDRFEAILGRIHETGAGYVPDPLLTADQLLGVLLGSFYLRRVLNQPNDPHDSLEEVVDVAIAALVPTRAGFE